MEIVGNDQQAFQKSENNWNNAKSDDEILRSSFDLEH
jgi:hypothetical protein